MAYSLLKEQLKIIANMDADDYKNSVKIKRDGGIYESLGDELSFVYNAFDPKKYTKLQILGGMLHYLSTCTDDEVKSFENYLSNVMKSEGIL